MLGRKESDYKIEKKNQELLVGKPQYIYNYYETLWNKAPYTKRDYISKLWYFMEYIQDKFNIDVYKLDQICEIKPSMIQQYLGSLRIKNASKAETFYSIKNFFKFLYNDDKIMANPCDKVEPPRDNEIHQVTYLTEDEIQLVLQNIKNGVGTSYAKKLQMKWKNRDMLLVVLGLSTGMRVSSLIEINIEDINFETKYISIFQKGNKQLMVKINDRIINLIKNWLIDRAKILGDDELNINALFISDQHKRITTATVRNIIKKYTFNIDKHITPHKLRSTCATTIIKETGNIYLASRRLGHANVETTKRYAAIDNEMEQQAVDAMDEVLF